ncbi:MAG TPA: ABC transporter permease [Flavitalea sp.]|nr:ABC transporter permease [Flavitalea sp.]
MLKNYFLIAWRNMLKSKTYSAINIAGLAIGLAAFWLIVMYIADELSYDRYHTNAHRIYRVVQYASWDDNNLKLSTTSAPFAPGLKAAFPEIEETVRIDPEGGGVMKVGENAIKADDIIFADKSFFNIFTHQFLFGEAAKSLTKPNSIVISETLARKLFHSPDRAINQTIYFENGEGNTVTGVIKDVPANSHLRFSAVRPLPAGYTDGWQSFRLYTYLLLKTNTDYQDLEKKLPQFASGTIQKEMGVKDYRLELQPLPDIHLHSHLDFELSANGNMGRIYIFIAIAILILIIAIINYMNLTTARSTARIREIGIRKTIGSGKWHLAAMFMSESVLVTLIAGLVGVTLVKLVLPFFNQLTGKNLFIWRFGMGYSLLLLVIFTVALGVVSGIYPSLFLSRFKTIPALKGQVGNMSSNIFFRKSLVVFQFVITVIMITGSLVVYKQLQYALHKDLGFNKDQVLTFHIDDRSVREHITAIKSQLLKNPVIESVSAAGNPIGNNNLGGNGYNFENSNGTFSSNSKMTGELMVDADYLKTMEIKLLHGRDFSNEMPTDKYGAALINETLMYELGWKDPIGKRMQFRIDDKGTMGQRTVVGVVKDFHTYSLQHKLAPLVMIMPPEKTSEDNLYVRIEKGKIQEGLAYIDQVYRRFDKTTPAEYNFLDKNFAKQYEAEEKQGQIAFVFTIIAVVIACLGLYGLVTFTAAQRIKEIGIRKVLGASVPNIIVLLSKDFAKLVVVATIIASPLAGLAMRRWLNDFAYRIDIDWKVFVLAGLSAILLAVVTVTFQAAKTALANPVNSLRTE